MEAETLGRRIRAFRKLKGYTQKGLAKALGISVSVLGEVERGTRLPSEQLLGKISEVLQVDVNEIIQK